LGVRGRGAAGFNQLNGLYTPEDPAGNAPDNDRILGALRSLKQFMQGFDFVRMKPDRDFVVGGIPSGVIYRGMSEPGRQYALYMHHSRLNRRGSSYEVFPGVYRENLVFNLPYGNYQAEWVNPSDGSVIASEKFAHTVGFRRMTTPEYSVDIALRIRVTQ